MAIMLFKLKDVPDDEAQDIRGLLGDNDIAYYETPASRWGISMEAIWLSDERQLELARRLIDAYQEARVRQAREEYERLRREGQIESVGGRMLRHPLLFLISLGFILIIVYFSIMPFMEFGKTLPSTRTGGPPLETQN